MGTIATRAAKARDQRLAPWRNWVAFYGVDADPRTLSAYDLVILDPGFRGSLESCMAKGGKTLGYLSLGEIRKTSALFPILADRSALLSENPNWPGTFVVDIRSPAWRALILERAIPELLSLGFSGVFYDTLDTPTYLEKTDPERFQGMRQAAIDLVRSIRRKFPQAVLAMNRGYDLLPDISREIDAVVAESFLTTHGSNHPRYRWVDAGVVTQQNDFLRPARERSPRLPVLSLDYWDPADPETIREIYRRERALGHTPYVGTILLDQIIPEPAA
jgi:uncharacterized protein (TIGR01370 family)